MKTLNRFITEKLKITKNIKLHSYFPKSKDELLKILSNKFENHLKGDYHNILDLNDINTSNITDMSHLFISIPYIDVDNIINIDISKWDVSNVIAMNGMFLSCRYLKSTGDLSDWDVSNVENMSFMFRDCGNLTFIGNINDWKIDSLKEMKSMFAWCKRLQLDITKWKLTYIGRGIDSMDFSIAADHIKYR